ncbi:MAG: TolC family protein, partial [Proteobacteria bacterium]|nr:TolC family protein [Pseudomonadota bacterium]
IGLVLLGPAAGQARTSSRFSMDQAVDLALKMNPRVEETIHVIAKARAAMLESRTAFLPKFTATYSWTFLSETPHSISRPRTIAPGITIPGGRTDVGTRNIYTLSVSASQTLFSGFKILNTYRIAKLGIDLAKVAREIVRHEIVLAAREAYLDILAAEKAVLVTLTAVRQLTSHVKRAKNFYAVGMIPKNDLLKSQVELANATQDLLKAKTSLILAKSALNTLLHRPLDAPLILTDRLQYQPTHYRLPECNAVGLKTRPEIKQLGLQLITARRQIHVAVAGYFPTVSLTWTYNKYADDPTMGSASRFQDADEWNVVVAATWTFWEWGKTSYQVRQARREHSRLQAVQKQTVDAIQFEIKKAYLELKVAEQNIFVAKRAVAQAQENYRMSVERYRAQVTTSTEVLDALTLLTKSQVNYFTALTDYNKAQARLRKAMGYLR